MLEYRYGSLILAGGQGKRMGGRLKANLTYGDTTFLSVLQKKLEFLSPSYLSANESGLDIGSELKLVPDCIPDCGPLGGIYSVLRVCDCEALLVVPCDMPFFSIKLVRLLLAEHEGEPVLYLQDWEEREYPLCGIYTKDCIPVIEKMLNGKDYRMRQVLKQAGGRILKTEKIQADPESFWNINTPDEYEKVKKLFLKEHKGRSKEV